MTGARSQADSDRSAERAEAAEESERHASNLELFLDLVFVFAVTQVAGLLATDTGPAGFGRGILLAWLVWWLWSQFTWLGTAIDLSDRSLNQFLVLAAVPLALLMTVAIPGAYGDSAVEFAGAYLAVNVWALAIQGRGLWNSETTRRTWLLYAPLAAVAPTLLLVGAFLDRGPRTAVWCFVAIVDVTSAITAGRRGAKSHTDWTIDPVHFVERHSLFVIISLGEVLVAAGIAASGVELTGEIGLGLLAAVSVACVFWWTYFSYVPGVIEAQLRNAIGADRSRVARNMFSFGHFPIIVGIVLYAVAAKHTIAHPGSALHAADLFALAASITSFVGGFVGLQWQAARRVAPERIVTIFAVAVLAATAGPHMPSAILVACVAAVIALSHAISLRRFVRNSTAATP